MFFSHLKNYLIFLISVIAFATWWNNHILKFLRKMKLRYPYKHLFDLIVLAIYFTILISWVLIMLWDAGWGEYTDPWDLSFYIWYERYSLFSNMPRIKKSNLFIWLECAFPMKKRFQITHITRLMTSSFNFDFQVQRVARTPTKISDGKLYSNS